MNENKHQTKWQKQEFPGRGRCNPEREFNRGRGTGDQEGWKEKGNKVNEDGRGRGNRDKEGWRGKGNRDRERGRGRERRREWNIGDEDRNTRSNHRFEQIYVPVENEIQGISQELVNFWILLCKNMSQKQKKMPFKLADTMSCELWRSCWRAAQTASIDQRLPINALIKAYLILPDQVGIHPPADCVLAVLTQAVENKSPNELSSFAKIVDEILLVVKDRLMSTESLSTVGDKIKVAEEAAKLLRTTLLKAIMTQRLQYPDSTALAALQERVDGQLFIQFSTALRREQVLAVMPSTGQERAGRNWMGWAERPTIAWLMSGTWHRDVPELKELYGTDGLQEYAETLLRIWTVLTFYWGSAALWPKCKERQQRNGSEEYCEVPLLCSTTDRLFCCEMLRRSFGPPVRCGELAHWRCHRHRHSGICISCLRKRQNELAGSGGAPTTKASTDVYDAFVSSEESRKDGTVFHLSKLASRRPPKVEPNWNTTYRLQCSGLVAVVKLGVQNETLQRDYILQWAEILPSKIFAGKGQRQIPEGNFRRDGRIALRLLGRGDLSVLHTEPDLPLNTHVAVIDLRVFVPEVLSVLSTFAHPHFAAHLQQIPFAKRFIGLQRSPPLLRLPTGATVEEYVRAAIDSSEIHCIRMLSRENKEEIGDQICALRPVRSLYGTQLEAFASALSSALHCTQGPPGTGKSYVGVCVILALIIIRTMVRSNGTPVGPILMLSYKNHALDEFLCDVLKFSPHLHQGQLIRLGVISNPALYSFSERNTPDEREAERAVQKRLYIHRAGRVLARNLLMLAQYPEQQITSAVLILKAMELLVSFVALKPVEGCINSLDDVEEILTSQVPSISALDTYTSLFSSWIMEVQHWREVFNPRMSSDASIKSLLARWLNGEYPPLKCAMPDCMHYSHVATVCFCGL